MDDKLRNASLQNDPLFKRSAAVINFWILMSGVVALSVFCLQRRISPSRTLNLRLLSRQ